MVPSLQHTQKLLKKEFLGRGRAWHATPMITLALQLLVPLAIISLALRRRRPSPCVAAPPPGGAFAELPHGRCHYLIDGRGNQGPLVVLVHGFVGSSSYLRFLARELAQTRRVLRFDLYGRGWSAHLSLIHI